VDTRQAFKVGFYRIHGMNKRTRVRFIARYGDMYQRALDTNDEETVAYIQDTYRDACDRLIDEGMFHNPAELTGDELLIVHDYAASHGLKLWLLEADQTEKAAYRESRGKLRYQPLDFLTCFTDGRMTMAL